MLKSCSKDLPSQLVLERKILFSRMLRKLGLQETTDSNGLKVLSSIEGAEPIQKRNQKIKPNDGDSIAVSNKNYNI
jgi:hypothetical protein